jgi:bifunctional non-homologous end joining protein LigD
MPERVEPCLAVLAHKPPAGADWAFEVKWDGYRVAIHVKAGVVRILTRGGHDWTHRFPSIAAAAETLPANSFILDGEAVVPDDLGASDFSALQQALGGRGGKRHAELAILFAFDLLYLDGRDLRRLSLDERRGELQRLVGEGSPTLRLSEEIVADGATFLRHACAMGLEGIIAKRRNAPYRSGRGGEWLKIKCVQSGTFVIVGYEFSPSALGGIGRLLLAARRGDTLTYVGGVGTGFTTLSARALRAQLDAITRDASTLPIKRKGVRWVTPGLTAQIAFRGWTNDGKLRHASYKGLREVADVSEIYRVDG